MPIEVAKMSNLVKSMLTEEITDERPHDVSLPNVTSVILAKVIDFCQHYKEEDPMTELRNTESGDVSDLVQDWYAAYVNVQHDVLLELLVAANFLEIKPLLDLTCAALAS